MRTFLRPLAVLLAAVLLTACGDSGNGALGTRAATVDGSAISRDLLERIVDAQTSGSGAPAGEDGAAATAEMQRNVLTTLIGIEIVAGLAEQEGVEVTDEDIAAAYEEQVGLFEEQAAAGATGEAEDFAGFVASIGLTEDEYRDLLVADAVRREALAAQHSEPVTDEEVRALYDETSEEQIDARHILVESEAEAQDAIERIEGGEDFADVAADVSTDGSAQDGGNLGVAPASRYVPEFAAAITDGEVGELLGPVESQFGFHVVEVLGKEPPPPFEEAEPQLRAQLEQQNQQPPELLALYEEAFAEADVTVAAGLGEWDPELGRVVDATATVGEGDPNPPTDGVAPGAPSDGTAPADPPEGTEPAEPTDP